MRFSVEDAGDVRFSVEDPGGVRNDVLAARPHMDRPARKTSVNIRCNLPQNASERQGIPVAQSADASCNPQVRDRNLSDAVNPSNR